MSKGPIKTRSIVKKLSPFWLPETPITAKNTGNKCEGKITFNNIRLSAAKVRLARSKFSYVQTQQRESKEGKHVVQTNSKVTSLWVMFGLSKLNSKKLVNQAFSQPSWTQSKNIFKHFFCFSFISGTFGNKRKASRTALSKEHECMTVILFRRNMPEYCVM